MIWTEKFSLFTMFWTEKFSVFVAYRYLRKNETTSFIPIGKKNAKHKPLSLICNLVDHAIWHETSFNILDFQNDMEFLFLIWMESFGIFLIHFFCTEFWACIVCHSSQPFWYSSYIWIDVYCMLLRGNRDSLWWRHSHHVKQYRTSIFYWWLPWLPIYIYIESIGSNS